MNTNHMMANYLSWELHHPHKILWPIFECMWNLYCSEKDVNQLSIEHRIDQSIEWLINISSNQSINESISQKPKLTITDLMNQKSNLFTRILTFTVSQSINWSINIWHFNYHLGFYVAQYAHLGVKTQEKQSILIDICIKELW